MNKTFNDVFSKSYWHNVSQFCDTKRHPFSIGYRRYRRGRNRCKECGAKIGKIHCERWRNKDKIVEHIFEGYPLLDLLRKKGIIKCVK